MPAPTVNADALASIAFFARHAIEGRDPDAVAVALGLCQALKLYRFEDVRPEAVTSNDALELAEAFVNALLAGELVPVEEGSHGVVRPPDGAKAKKPPKPKTKPPSDDTSNTEPPPPATEPSSEADGTTEYETPPKLDEEEADDEPKVRRLRLTGMHFEHDKTFLLPSAMNGIRMLVRLYDSYPGSAVLVNGHADRKGDANYNRTLSRERAMAVRAYLTDDVDLWLGYYTWSMKCSQWGTREDQYMLATVCDDATGAPFYVGPINGDANQSREALHRFQDSRGLPQTWSADAATRRELVTAYMGLDKTTLHNVQVAEIHGCGEAHPRPETLDDPSEDQPLNRRVEVFLFESGQIEPPPQSECPKEGCGEYQAWVDITVLTIDLDAPPGALWVSVVDDTGAAVDGASVVLRGVVRDQASSQNGGVLFACLVPSDYTIKGEKEGYDPGKTTAQVPSGVDPAGSEPTATAVLVLKRQLPPEGNLGEETCRIEFLGEVS